MIKFIITEEERKQIKNLYEQFHGEITPTTSGFSKKSEVKDKFLSDMKAYQDKMDIFVDELKQNVPEIDKKRLATQIRNETDRIFWKYYDDENISPEELKPVNDLFSQLQLDILNHFKEKLRLK